VLTSTLLVGEEEFQKYDMKQVSNYITEFTFRALGLKEKPGAAQPLAPGVEP
jgi:hypothetical protein